jgi:shikimate kinase
MLLRNCNRSSGPDYDRGSKRLSQTFVAEIIGPAGAGKTTLSHLLRAGADVRTGLSLWRLPKALLAMSALSSVPTFLALCRSPTRLGWEDIKLVIQLNALRMLLKRESSKGYQALVLDEGTVFALAKLHAFGDEQVETGNADFWMREPFSSLAPMLDAVIWLDAPDAVLARRIRERKKPHSVKHGSDAEIQEHLGRYRESFELVVAELEKRNGLKVLRFRTDEESLADIAAKVLSQAHLGV